MSDFNAEMSMTQPCDGCKARELRSAVPVVEFASHAEMPLDPHIIEEASPKEPTNDVESKLLVSNLLTE